MKHQKFAAGMAALAIAGALTVIVDAPAAHASCSGGNYYARATSGLGNFKGTGQSITTWSSWSVNGHPHGFSDEATWVFNQQNTNSTNALEVGFFTGYGVGNYGGGQNFTNAMVPYFTLGNGAQEYDDWGRDLPANTAIWDSATSDGSRSWAYVNSQPIATPISYGVSYPHWALAQGETNYADIWMGGGSGDPSDLYYQDQSNNWYNWGWQSDCQDSPYWVYTGGSGFYFENGGY